MKIQSTPNLELMLGQQSDEDLFLQFHTDGPGKQWLELFSQDPI